MKNHENFFKKYRNIIILLAAFIAFRLSFILVKARLAIWDESVYIHNLTKNGAHKLSALVRR